jgi:hypothetical protein
MNKTLIIVCIGLLLIPMIFVSGCASNTITNSQTPPKNASQHPVISGQAAFCPNPPTPTVTDKNVRQAPSMSEPAPRTPYTDPVFGTCVVRVTDRHHDLSADDKSPGLKNEYSRVQSFNADESKTLVRGTYATWYLYDANTLQPLRQLAFQGAVDPRWDASNPNVLYYVQSDPPRLMSYNIQTQKETVVHNFANDFSGQSLAAVWTRYEGSPSLDGRYWGLLAESQDWHPVAFVVYDQQTDKVIAKRDVEGLGDIDWVSISPLGDYFVALYPEKSCPSSGGDESHPCGLMVYDRNLAHGKSLKCSYAHGDLAFDANGREVIVFQDNSNDYLSMADLATGTVTQIYGPIDFSHTGIGFHISGRAFNHPGWVLVSTTDETPTSYTWMDDQVFAMELKPNGRIVRLAHDHTVVDPKQEHDYWAEPHGSVNRDFTRVLFTSNWGRSGTEQVEMYMVVLPKGWI